MLERMQYLRKMLVALISSLNLQDKRVSSSADLGLLQDIVDAGRLTADDTDEWEAMGIAFGDVLITLIPRLTWTLVIDDFGTDAVLRYQDISLRFGVVTMLLRRIEEREIIDVFHIANWLKAYVEEQAHCH